MQLKTFILTLFLAAALPLLAYEAPITEPGATGVNDMYTTADGNLGGPNHGPNRATMDDGWLDPANPGSSDPNSPVGAPWILLGFAAAYGVAKLRKH